VTGCDLYIVLVTDEPIPALVGHAGAGRYVSPPQDEEQARALVRVLTGSPRTPTGTGPWARPLAGGRRHISLRPAGDESLPA
jgi:hypothetical protein